MRSIGLIASAFVVAVVTTGIPRDAQACGGCFLPPQETPTVVTSHKMAVSISQERTILWDQITYSGAPQDFAWVLPVKPGAVVEVASDAFFEALDAATQVTVTAPRLNCSGGGGVPFFFPFGCASAESLSDGEAPTAGGGGVTVLHKGTIGPYETVTLRSTNGDSLATWLNTNGYTLSPSDAPVVQSYVDEEFDFIALKLRPGEDVDSMKPVRVVFPGASFSLPLRMVAAGTGEKVGITLFVVGEGRWGAQNAANVEVDEQAIEWDFSTSSSTYTAQREEALKERSGNAWLTTHALPHVLFSERINGATGGPVTYATDVNSGTASTTIADAFADQAVRNGETTTSTCKDAFRALDGSTRRIVNPCTDAGCRTLAADEFDARSLACGPVDDLAAALTGMRANDVWVTRLEADLPRSALASDLQLSASTDQAPRNNLLFASKGKNPPANCEVAGALAAAPRRGSEVFAGLLSMMGPMALGMVVLRRASRRR